MELNSERTCRVCNRTLPISEYYFRKGKPSGNRCKDCTKAASMARYHDPVAREKIRATSRAYYLEHNGKDRPRRIPCGLTPQQRLARWRQTEKGRASTRKWSLLMRDNANEWRRTSPRYRETAARYRQTETWKAMSKRAGARRRARMKIVSTLTAAEWREIQALYRHRCAYCGRTDLPLTQDHLIPLAMGGPHTKQNVVPACQPCNSRKGAKTGLGL